MQHTVNPAYPAASYVGSVNLPDHVAKIGLVNVGSSFEDTFRDAYAEWDPEIHPFHSARVYAARVAGMEARDPLTRHLERELLEGVR